MAQATLPPPDAKPPTGMAVPTSAFSFTAPFPPDAPNALKQRRVSLALPSSSPRLVPAWSFRDDTGLPMNTEASGSMEPKGKMRKIEPSPLVMPIDEVKPEKKTRKKWSQEETEMLVKGCNKHGVGNWKAMLKDPELTFDGRSAVDLKDRFRTYYPDAYKTHYPNAKTHLSSKVRSTLPDGTSIFEKTRSKKRRPFTDAEDRALRAGYEKHGTVWSTIVRDPVFREQNRRSTDLRDRFRNAFPELYQAAGYKPRNTAKKKCARATDDGLVGTSSGGVGPARSRRRALTSDSLFRGGVKSVPQSVTNSDDEASCDEDEDETKPLPPQASPPEPSASTSSEALGEYEMQALDDPLSEFMQGSSQPIEPWPASSAWTAGSPASSHMSSADYFVTQSPHSMGRHPATIGKSAWGTQDWLSANPRLEPRGASSSSASSYAEDFSPAMSSPFSLASLGGLAGNYGVFDRYDLLPSAGAFAHDFASEVGMGDTHSTFSDPDMFTPSSFRGFTHHSNYAGDLIFGARTHQPQQTSFGFGLGLGLSGATVPPPPPSTGVHPSQLHTPSLAGIDELGLTAIDLNDDGPESMPMEDVMSPPKEPEMMELTYGLPPQTLEEIAGLSAEMHQTPPATPVRASRPLRPPRSYHSMPAPAMQAQNRSLSVPPAEHRAESAFAALDGQGAYVRPPLTPTRSLSLLSTMSQLHMGDLAAHWLPPINHMEQERHWTDADPAQLPFLDLHYYGAGAPEMVDTGARQGQALDLAQSVPRATSFAAAGAAFGARTPQLVPAQVVAAPRMGGHVRGMTQDGQFGRAGASASMTDNKRKRMSWDGMTS